MSAKQIVVLGGGFAGLWSAVGAARKLDELRYGPETAEITVVNRDSYHGIRVRNYETDLTEVRVPLDDVLGPVGIRRVEGEVAAIDLARQAVIVTSAGAQRTLPYDRLVFALGSQLLRPDVPGLVEYCFDVDTYLGAARLNVHLQSLLRRPVTAGQWTVVVVGAGLTGIEAATEMTGKLRSLLAETAATRPFRVILADHKPWVGSDMGNPARMVIEEALAALGIELRLGVEIVAIGPSGVTLKSGEEILADTVVWCAGMRANPLTRLFDVEHDQFGRIAVDAFMRVKGLANVFAAGDVAWAMMDDCHASIMSCQHGRPMGRFAGNNVVSDLFGLPMLPLRIAWYVTVLDLGSWGAVYTEGWDRHVVTKGEAAKKTKQVINRQRIYPPLTGNRNEILAAAAPVVQQQPATFH
jgi:NADH dehydrogenase